MKRTFVLGLIAASAACGGAAETVRATTYPPTFEYLEKKEIRTSMWSIAQNARDLDRLLRVDERPPNVRAEVLRLLDDLATSADTLSSSAKTNHPMLDAHLSSFQRDIRIARDDVRREPPSYFLAGTISGSCLYCHR